MRTLLVSICCLSLASFAGAAQQQQSEQDNPNPKGKKGQSGQTSQQVVAPTPHPGGKTKYHAQGNVSGAGAGTNVNVQQNATIRTHHGKVSGQTETNVSERTNLNSSKSNKLESIHKGGSEKWKGPSLNAKQGKFQKQHFNLPNKTKPEIQNVKFTAGAHIQGSQKWQGSKYVVFRNYSPQWHDQIWWTSHHSRVVFVFGGWYFWDGGYWYPAWGYAPDAIYAYDRPIYAGSEEIEPRQVVANVQSALQQQGYYQGEVDGILGPQTRAALAEYQSAQGLEPTGTVDEPTLETLGMV